MIDRRQVAVLLVVLGGMFAVISSYQDMYVFTHNVYTETWTFTTSLWGWRSNLPGDLYLEPVAGQAWPVLIFAGLMVAAAVLTLRGWAAARVGLLAAAGGFCGVVAAFVVGGIHENELAGFREPDTTKTITYLPGFYLLIAAAILGMVGAVLAQRVRRPAQLEEVR